MTIGVVAGFARTPIVSLHYRNFHDCNVRDVKRTKFIAINYMYKSTVNSSAHSQALLAIFFTELCLILNCSEVLYLV